MDIAEAKHLISVSTKKGEAFGLFTEVARRLNFCSIVLSEVALNGASVENAMVFILPDDEWPVHYIHRQFHNVDPVVYLMRSLQYSFITWDMARPYCRANSQSMSMFIEAERFNLFDGCVVVRFTPAHTLGYLSFAGGSSVLKSLSAIEIMQLKELADAAILMECRFSGSFVSDRKIPLLGQRSLEILPALIEGYSNLQIGELHGVTEGSVEPHVTKLFQEFGIPEGINRRVRLAVEAVDAGFRGLKPQFGKEKFPLKR
ncbi:MAG: autoinducer binding domain-containing protein [Kordiimonadaceae bacterium]|nr:autoinducer binding domain-containing protein [Kordiimonadaceae bacterium]